MVCSSNHRCETDHRRNALPGCLRNRRVFAMESARLRHRQIPAFRTRLCMHNSPFNFPLIRHFHRLSLGSRQDDPPVLLPAPVYLLQDSGRDVWDAERKEQFVGKARVGVMSVSAVAGGERRGGGQSVVYTHYGKELSMADISVQVSLPSLRSSPLPSLSHRLALLSLAHHPLLVPILAKLWTSLHSHPSFRLHLDSQTYAAALKGIFATAEKVLDSPGQLSLWDLPVGTGVAFGRFCYDVVGIVGVGGNVEEVENRVRRLFRACTESVNRTICLRKDLDSPGKLEIATPSSLWLPDIRAKWIESPTIEGKRTRPVMREKVRFHPGRTSILLPKTLKSPTYSEKSAINILNSL